MFEEQTSEKDTGERSIPSKEIPTEAVTTVSVGVNKIYQNLEFHYYDPDGQFSSLQLTGALDGELDYMRENMDYYLNQDKLFLNNQELPLHVKSCQVHFIEDDYQRPVAKFLIESDEYSLKKGVNTVLLVAREEKVDYPCYSTWNFPGMVLKVNSLMDFEIKDHKVTLTALAGKSVGGREEFKFMKL